MTRHTATSRGKSLRRFTGWPGTRFVHGKGFGTADLLAGLSLVAVVAGLAAPEYMDAVDKRRVVNDAEQVEAFVNLAKSEAVRRFEPVTVSYTAREDGDWCIGAVLGNSPCDCMETEPADPDFCAIDDAPWLLRDQDLQSPGSVRAMHGDGAYVIDPVRGILADPRDGLKVGLGDAIGRFRVELEVRPTGYSALCVPKANPPIRGIAGCTNPT